MTEITTNKLIKTFGRRRTFTRKELLQYYLRYEPGLKEGTFVWRIHDLKNKNIIKSLKRGVYMISHTSEYKPNPSPDLIKVIKQLSESFDQARYCVWEMAWLNEFTQHQITSSALFIEVEKGLEESFFYAMKDNSYKEVFVNPDQKVIDFYIAESNRPIIIKKMVTRAPLIKRAENKVDFYIPSLEKILVDLFTEEHLFYYLQGSELIHIYENVLSKYTLNFTKLFSYAQRREKKQDIKQFMIDHVPHLVKDIMND